jgi:hypothetical protein
MSACCAALPHLSMLPCAALLQGVVYTHRSNYLHALVAALPDAVDLKSASSFAMVCVCVCARARACVRACVRACACGSVGGGG